MKNLETQEILSKENAAEIQRKEERWKRTGKGRGNRWLMLRDLLAIVSLRPMSLMMIQDTMLAHRGLTRNKVRDFLDQLERARAIEQVEDNTGRLRRNVFIATEGGVSFWIHSRKDIPASIVQVAYLYTDANKLEV